MFWQAVFKIILNSNMAMGLGVAEVHACMKKLFMNE